MSRWGLDNLPYGVDDQGHVVVAYEEEVVDLTLAQGLDVGPDIWGSGSLDAFFGLGPDAWARTRAQLRSAVADQPPAARRPRSAVRLVLPWTVADYADFYASRQHATNMGRIIRPGAPPLPPAWLHLPIGYHGRAGTVVVSGSAIPRPAGLRPGFGPTERLDVEVELGFVVGAGVPRGRSIGAEDAARHIFGAVLVNDWSARDIQAFEYQPLGPFLGKSFATSVSPWVVPLPALEPYRVEGPRQEPAPAEYLRVPEPRGVDVRFALAINGCPVSSTSAAGLYWSMAQQLAHLTVNGAGVRAGDLFASGTISGSEPGTQGSLMELTDGGRHPIALSDGTKRVWLEDGDTVAIRGWCGDSVSFGAVTGTVEP